MRRAETLLQEALRLPDDERAEIAGALLESLEPAPEADVETAWRQEVADRVAVMEAGGGGDDSMGRDPRSVPGEVE
ncbi:MAG TPA: addiction module protein [Thermoanaerobaculia bacterium]|jgi:hypothetical protein|nr:addiction module protein [Thermoanaerobaculia bacterium]